MSLSFPFSFSRPYGVLSATVLVCFLSIAGASYCADRTLPPNPVWFFGNTPTSIAHRGASGHAPENTLLAFRAALEMGAHVLEMDLQLTADGHVVVLHDGTLDRTTDGSGPAVERTLDEVRALDAAYRFPGPAGDFPLRGKGIGVPTLSEVLETFPTTPLLLEMKSQSGPEIVARTAETLARHERFDNVVVAAFDTRLLRRFRTLLPDVPTAFGRSEVRDLYLMHLLGLHRYYRPPAELLLIPEKVGPWRLVKPRFIRAARRLELSVGVWTVNAKEDMERLIEMGVGGIVTDFPDRVPLPPPLAR